MNIICLCIDSVMSFCLQEMPHPLKLVHIPQIIDIPSSLCAMPCNYGVVTVYVCLVEIAQLYNDLRIKDSQLLVQCSSVIVYAPRQI